MATSKEYIQYVCDQLQGVGSVRSRSMFGEYMVYVNDKPLLPVCDNCVYIKTHPSLAAMLADAPLGQPYPGAKPHHVLDIDNIPLCHQAIGLLEPEIPLPKPRPKRKQSGGKVP